MNKILPMLVVLTLVIGCSILKPTYSYKKPQNKKHHAIIKITSLDGGSCSAFVISNNMALTAAHCVLDCAPIIGCKLALGPYFVINSEGKLTDTVAEVNHRKVDRRMDYAVLMGNFKNFNKMPVAIKSLPNDTGDKLVHCGYPYGNYPPLCLEGKLSSRSGFHFGTTAFLVPGMSGGPVINSDGVAIGINSYVDLDKAYYCPTVGILQTEENKKD